MSGTTSTPYNGGTYMNTYDTSSPSMSNTLNTTNTSSMYLNPTSFTPTTIQSYRRASNSISERLPSIADTSETASPPQRPQAHPNPSDKSDEANAPPKWTSMKTKAGKERKRLPLACIACRRKKIRCSGEHPACKHCLRSRIPCVYKVTTRKAAPRTDYMAMLDKRLKRMEDRVIKFIPKGSSIVLTTGRGSVRPPTAAPPPKVSKKRAAETSVDELEIWAKSTATTTPLNTTGTHEVDEQNLLKEGADKLPPREVQEHLAEVFFDYVYGQSYHLLHKPSFMRRLAQGEIAPVLVLAVCAMAARFSDHPAIKTSEPAFLRGEEWATAAREISLKRYDSPNITILIVYLILTLHEFGTCQGGRSWMFAGMAQRMAYAMQLHHDLAHDPRTQHSAKKVKFSHTDREIRRRTMWACFMTDRYCSSGTERPTFISVDHLKLQLPIREDYFQMELTGQTEDLAGKRSTAEDEQMADNMEDPMGVAAYMIRAVAVWGECINYYNQGGKSKDQYPMWDERSGYQLLRKSIQNWKNTLPERLQYNLQNLATHASEKIANQFIFMHIIYHQTSLFVNRFALPLAAAKTTAKGIPVSFIQDSAKAALDAANNVSSLVHDGMSYNVVAPFAGYSAFFSSTVHIHGAFSKNTNLVESSNKHLTWNINYLTKMKKHWGMFNFMTENLRDLYKKHVEAARSTGDTDKSGDAIFQYGDWFDRYPHGVSGTDFDEPQSNVKKEPGADAGLAHQSDLQTVEEFFSNHSPAAPLQRQKGRKKKEQRAQQSFPTQQMDVYGQIAAEGISPAYPTNIQQIFPTGQTLEETYLSSQAALSYGAYDPNVAMAFSMPGAYDPLAVGMNFNSGMGSMPDLMAGQQSYQAAASGGWFMPMNLDAAALAEASGPFSTGSLDWDAQFDMANMQVGMTQAQHDLENQRNG